MYRLLRVGMKLPVTLFRGYFDKQSNILSYSVGVLRVNGCYRYFRYCTISCNDAPRACNMHLTRNTCGRGHGSSPSGWKSIGLAVSSTSGMKSGENPHARMRIRLTRNGFEGSIRSPRRFKN